MKHFLGILFFISSTMLVAEGNPLNDHERRLLAMAQVKQPSTAWVGENIVLILPTNVEIAWDSESLVKNPQDMVRWLDRAYRFMAHWTEFDPNLFYQKQNGVFDRLVFVLNGRSDFNFGYERRPSIGLRDGKDPLIGTSGWFGWLSHELAHDFWHRHPYFRMVKNGWGEGLCDYIRFKIQIAMGMLTAGMRDYDTYMKAAYTDPYHGGARLLLEFEEKYADLDGPREVLRKLRTDSMNNLLLRPPWEMKFDCTKTLAAIEKSTT